MTTITYNPTKLKINKVVNSYTVTFDKNNKNVNSYFRHTVYEFVGMSVGLQLQRHTFSTKI